MKKKVLIVALLVTLMFTLASAYAEASVAPANIWNSSLDQAPDAMQYREENERIDAVLEFLPILCTILIIIVTLVYNSKINLNNEKIKNKEISKEEIKKIKENNDKLKVNFMKTIVVLIILIVVNRFRCNILF